MIRMRFSRRFCSALQLGDLLHASMLAMGLALSRERLPLLRAAAGAVSGRKPQQMADGIDEIGAVQRVEVELADALVDEVHDLLGGHGGRHQMRGLQDRCRGPRSGAPATTASLAPQRTAKPATWRKLWIGTMPGMIGTQMPRARAPRGSAGSARCRRRTG